jgi:hypothetical protein
MNPKAASPSPARRIPRWLLVLGSLALLLGLTTMVAPFFIPWDKLKDEAVSAGSKFLGRPLGIDQIEVSLFSGVHIKNLRLANAQGGFSDQALFTNDDAKVDVNLLSLFTGRLVINSITFIKPQILIETNARGISNLQGLGSPSSASSSGKSSPASGMASATVGGETFPAVLLALVIQDGDVIVRDRQKGTETAVHGLNIKLQGLSLAAAGASRLEADMVAELQGKMIPLSLTCDFNLDMARERVDIGALELKAPALDATVTGSVQGFKAPDVDLKIGAGLDLGQLDGLLPPSVLAGLPPDLKTSGALKLDLGVQGAVARPQALALKGSLVFNEVAAVVGSYPALGGMNGTMSFDRAGAELPDLSFNLGGDPASLAFKADWGDLSGLMGPRDALRASVSYTLRSPKLNLDPILAMEAAPSAPAKAPAQGGGASAGQSSSAAPSIPRGLSVEGKVSVDSLVVKGFSTGKLIQVLSVRKQRLNSATDLELCGGRVYERSTADMSRSLPVFKSLMGVSGLDFRALVDEAAAADPDLALSQLKGKVEGTLSVKASVQGRGFAEPALMDNASTSVEFMFADGVIHHTDMMERIAAAVSYPGIQSFLRSDLKFSRAEGSAQYSRRRVTLKSFSLGSGADWRQGSLFVQATGVMVPGGSLDFKIVPHFSPSLGLMGGDLGRAFEDSKGWPTFDYIEYSGPSSSAARADFSAALNKAARKAVEQHMGQIKQAAQKALEQNAGGLLKQLPGGLNKLFGQ